MVLLSTDILRRIDAVCDDFEAAWRGGAEPLIQDYLLANEVAERRQLLDSLLELQRELILTQARPKLASASIKPNICSHRSIDQQNSESSRQAFLPASSVDRQVAEKSPQRIEISPQIEDDSLLEIQDWATPWVELKIISGPHRGQAMIFDSCVTILVGRSSHAQIRLQDDQHFSREHCRLQVNPRECLISDLNSHNGTFVNGERIIERSLQNGDIVSGGLTTIMVLIRQGQKSEAELGFSWR